MDQSCHGFKKKKNSVTLLNKVSVKGKELSVDAFVPSEVHLQSASRSLGALTHEQLGARLKTCGGKSSSLNTFSHTFHYVTHDTDSDPTFNNNIPHSLHLTDRCRKLDFETYQDLRTNTRGSGDGIIVHLSWFESLTVT